MLAAAGELLASVSCDADKMVNPILTHPQNHYKWVVTIIPKWDLFLAARISHIPWRQVVLPMVFLRADCAKKFGNFDARAVLRHLKLKSIWWAPTAIYWPKASGCWVDERKPFMGQKDKTQREVHGRHFKTIEPSNFVVSITIPYLVGLIPIVCWLIVRVLFYEASNVWDQGSIVPHKLLSCIPFLSNRQAVTS